MLATFRFGTIPIKRLQHDTHNSGLSFARAHRHATPRLMTNKQRIRSAPPISHRWSRSVSRRVLTHFVSRALQSDWRHIFADVGACPPAAVTGLAKTVAIPIRANEFRRRIRKWVARE